MQIDEALECFLRQLLADGRSPHTISQYRRHVLLLASWAREEGLTANLTELDHKTMARFLGSSTARKRHDGAPRRAGSANALRSSMKGFFGYLHKAGYLTEDPSRLVRRANCGSRPPRSLGLRDGEQLLAALGREDGVEARRDHALFALMLGTGLRLSTTLALDVEDLDLERGEMRLRRLKGGGEEVGFLPPSLVIELQAFVGGRTSGALFLANGRRRISVRHVQRRLSEWLSQAGIRGRFSPHSLRHSFAMRLYERTRDVLLVKEALGHRSITSTLVYARANRESVRAAISAA